MRYIRDNLAVCGFGEIGSPEDFLKHCFQAQLQCTEYAETWLSQCLEVRSAFFDDGMQIPKTLFASSREWLGRHWDVGSKILISCAAGQSRSVTMAIALLSDKGRMAFVDAAIDVIRHVPDAYPHPYVLASAAAYSDKPLHLDALQGIYESLTWRPKFPWSHELLRSAVEQTYG